MSKRATLLTTTAAAALVGAMTSGAWAFEVVDWNWTSTVTTNVTVNPTLQVDSVVQLEKIQTHLGSITANSSLSTVTGTSVDVNNNATAVSNNQSITTDTPLLLHDLQIGAGALTPTFGDDETPNWEGLQDGLAAIALAYAAGNPLDNMNEHTIFGVATLLAAGNGYIAPAAINATANVNTATIDTNFNNNATAVTNNANYVVDTAAQASPGTGIMIADLGQLGIANVTANASSTGLTLDGATNVNTSATAVGNNLNIRVGPVNAFDE